MIFEFSEPIPKSESCCAIYAIINTQTGDCYIGSAVILYRRLLKHRACLRGGYHDNPKLQNAYNKYGEDAFVFVKVELCTQQNVLEQESNWIASCKTHYQFGGYNICPVAGTKFGCKTTEEQKHKISSALKKLHAEHPEIAKRAGKKRQGRRLSPAHIAATVAGCSKHYKLMSPAGDIFEGKNMAEFCRAHRLHNGAISRLRLGTYPKNCYRGWKWIS